MHAFHIANGEVPIVSPSDNRLETAWCASMQKSSFGSRKFSHSSLRSTRSFQSGFGRKRCIDLDSCCAPLKLVKKKAVAKIYIMFGSFTLPSWTTSFA